MAAALERPAVAPTEAPPLGLDRRGPPLGAVRVVALTPHRLLCAALGPGRGALGAWHPQLAEVRPCVVCSHVRPPIGLVSSASDPTMHRSPVATLDRRRPVRLPRAGRRARGPPPRRPRARRAPAACGSARRR